MAIDTEFVLLHHEETEISSDGTKTLLRPKKCRLLEFLLFVVKVRNKVFLSLMTSLLVRKLLWIILLSSQALNQEILTLIPPSWGLVTRQTSYKRLWLLLNLGCIFVGHGLSNDFRIVNIHVPENQIIDTSLLFHLPEYKRYLSLKFLAFALLNENVQTGNHDSIEDAVTALRLYKVYKRCNPRARMPLKTF